MENLMNIPRIEQVKIQAQVLAPIVKAFQAELGFLLSCSGDFALIWY